MFTTRPVPGKIFFAWGAVYPKPWPYWAKKDGKHVGEDYECYYENVTDVAAGTVVHVGNDLKGWGYYIRINHGGGLQTLYAHLSEIKVKSGQKVTPGEVIAISGNSGSAADLPHLHFEVWEYGVKVDPEKYFTQTPVPVYYPPNETTIPETGSWKLKERFTYLNIRSGPGAEYEDVGDLSPGQVVKALSMAGEIWIETEDGWVAVLHYGTNYLARVK